MQRQSVTLGCHTQMNIIKQLNFCVVIIPQSKSFFEASTMTFAHLARFEMNTSPSLRKDAGQHNIPSFNTPFCAKFAFVLTREHIRKRAIHLLFSHSIKCRSSECLNQAGTPHEKYNKRFANFTLASCLDKLSWKIFLRNLASELECEGVTLKVKSSIGSVKPLFGVAINWTVRVYSRSIVVLHLVGGRSVGDNPFSRN